MAFPMCDGDYIMTPGRHRINVNEFLLDVDRQASQRAVGTNPALFASAAYAHDIYFHWRKLEAQMDANTFNLSFADDLDVEKFRMMAVQCIFNYALAAKLSINTVHMALLNVNRLVYHRISPEGKMPLSEGAFACTVISALRAAVKFEETPHQSDKLRFDPSYIWRTSGFCAGLAIDTSVETLNKVEADNMRVLDHPMSPPAAPEFLERYLVVGAWPAESVQKYRELACFLLGLALFAFGSS
eukprot:Polyplicarium_translucidae@DN2059_c0_g2_i1.p1